MQGNGWGQRVIKVKIANRKPFSIKRMKVFKLLFCLLSIIVTSRFAYAQHEHHQMQRDTTIKESKKLSEKQMHDMDHNMSHHAMDSSTLPMSHSYSLNLHMNRNGSGTGWLPDAAPMYGYMVHSKKWMYMFHGNIFIRYNSQDVGNKGSRGASKVDAPNWFMAMGQRRVGQKGLFHFNTMFSLDPLFGGNGYPLLFQTGEAYKGKPLVDRQHPHDLFSELSIAYTQSFTNDIDAFVYLGYPGEPALGPVAFMHRPSSLNNPDASLGHHWQDATHITFGVATIGLRYKMFKLDASLFTGREPNEERYGFDKPRFDSYSYRLTVNPAKTLSAQVSRAFIKSPEALNSDENIDRTTASFTHALPLNGENNFLTSTFVWGNNNSSEGHMENSYTLESNLQLDKFAVYGRFENIEKSASELLVIGFENHTNFDINALTLGLSYTIWRQANTNFTLGTQGTLYSPDKRLESVYGNSPKAIEVYLRISPGLMNMGKMQM